MKRTEKMIIAISLAIGVVFGISGSIFAYLPTLQNIFYQISSMGLIVGSTFLTIKYLRKQLDTVAIGFLIFTLGEAIMTVGTPLGQVGGQAAFGAGIALYVPALLLISLPRHFPNLVRFTGFAACIPFGIIAAKIFLGQQVLSTEPITGAAYGLLSLTIIGWIFTLFRGALFAATEAPSLLSTEA